MNDQISQQWLDFFANGGQHFIPYNLPYLAASGREESMSNIAGVGGGSAVVLLGLQGLQAVVAQWYFGTNPVPSIGISQRGLHFPTVPLIMWEDIIAINFTNLRGTWSRASNSFMLPDPGVGTLQSADRTETSILFRNATAIKATVDRLSAPVINEHRTPRGQDWGEIIPWLDPALGAEQTVEFLYLVYLMCAVRGIPIYHSGGLFGIFNSDKIMKNIIRAN